MIYRSGIACLLLGAALWAGYAVAQDATPNSDQPAATADKSQADTNFIQRWKDDGVSLRFVWANDWAASVRGGEHTGQTNGGGAVGGADLDMGKLAGIDGGKIHVTFARYYGHSISANDIGVTQKIQGYWYPKRQWQLGQLTWEQSFDDNHFNALFGRVNATWQFARSTYGCRFVSAPDCPYQLTNTTGGFSGFPYVNWGGRIRYQPSSLYFSVGAFEINPDRRNNNGLDWGLENSTGVMVPVEVGHVTTFATDPYPHTIKVGGWYNSADYTDPELNTRGVSKALFGGTFRTYDGGRYGVYALGDKVVWKPDPTSNTRNLALFGSVSAPLDSAEIYTLQSTAGFVWTGPFASRPTDSLNFQASYFKFTKRQVQFEDDLLTKAKKTGSFSRNETMLELNYSYKLFPLLSLVPNIQYIVHPDVLGNTTHVTHVSANALVWGLRVMFNFGGPGSQ